MATSTTIRNIADTFVASSTPKKNFGKSGRMYVGSNHLSYLYWGNPVPRNARVISARLHFYSAGTWAGSVTPVLQRVNAAWSANKVTWTNDPGVIAGTWSPAAKTGATNGTHWIIDITSLMQTVANGGVWYGVRMTANGAAQKGLYTSQSAASRRPWVEITWSDAPFPPSNMVPRQGSAIGTDGPRFQWNFVDYSGNRDMASYQLQIATAANMTGIIYDTGSIDASVPEHDLSDHYNVLTNGQFTVDASNWAAVTNCAIARSTAQFRSSPASLALTSSAAGLMRARSTELEPCTPGKFYAGIGYVRSATAARTCNLEIAFLDAGGATVGVVTSGSTVTSSTSAWSSVMTVSAQCPVGATNYSIRMVVSGTAAAGEVHYFDDMQMAENPILATRLTAGTTYYWRVKNFDGAGLDSGYSAVQSFKYVAPPTVTITNPTGVSPYVEEPTPIIGWTFSGTQTAYQVILYDSADYSKVLWDSKKVTSANNFVTVPAKKITVPGQTYRIVVRVWDNQTRMAVPGYPPYALDEKDFVYQYNASVSPVSSISAAFDTLGLAVNLTVVRGTSPDSFVLLRNGVVIQTNIQPIDVQNPLAPTNYIIQDLPPGRRNATYSVICVVNGVSSASNPTVSFSVRRKFSWLMDPDGGNPICLANPDHDLQDGEMSSVLQAVMGDPALITQSLYGESGSFSARLADNLISTLSARTMKDSLRAIRKSYNGHAWLLFSDESMEVYIHNLKVKRINKSDGTTQYDVNFDFFQVT